MTTRGHASVMEQRGGAETARRALTRRSRRLRARIDRLLCGAVLASLTMACGTKTTDSAHAPDLAEPLKPTDSRETMESSSLVPSSPAPSAAFEPSPVYPPPPPSRPLPQNVPPTLLEAYRIAGTKEIEPSTETRDAIGKTGRRAIASIKLCLDTSGSIEKPTLLKSSGYPEYDNLIVEQIATSWRFRPYEVNGRVTRVCTAATFLFPKVAPDPTIPADTQLEHVGGYWCISYTVSGVASSGCGTDVDYCENFKGTHAALQKWGMADRSDCEWHETAWQTKVTVDNKKEDWLFLERPHCEESASMYRGTSCKQVRNRGARQRPK